MWRRRKKRPDDSGDDQSAIAAAAIALLARRDFSSGELARRLCERGYETSAVQAALADLSERRYFDDARYAANFVTSKAQRGHGPARIRQELAQQGLAAEEIDPALHNGADWPALARQVRVRKFGEAAPDGWAERSRQARFLQYRGFSVDHIRSALGPDVDPD
jgi:regulatory protein